MASSTPDDDLRPEYDVVVIGAGFAGLTAARDLSSAGKTVLLVEARDRIGGRTWTARGQGDAMFEMGGAWVHWSQPHVFAELQRYGLDDFVETHAHPDGCPSFSKTTGDGPLVAADPGEAEEVMAATEALMARFLDIDGQGGRSVIPYPFNTPNTLRANPSYADVDRLSVSDRVEQLPLSAEEKEALMAHAASFYGVPPTEAAYAEVLHTFALCGFRSEMMDEATMKYKLASGMTAFANAILRDVPGHRLFSSPVQSITDTGDSCLVQLQSSRQFRARAVVSTVPWNVLSSVRFEPPLSALRRDALANGALPARTDKLLATTSSPLPYGLDVSCEGGELPLTMGFADGVQAGEPLLTFLVKPGSEMDADDEVIRLLGSLHPDGLVITSARAHLWSKDPYAGGVMPVRRPGFVRRYYAEIRRPHGRVFFCGSDFADGWRGFLSGAFESAYRVTRDVLDRWDEL